MAFSFSVSPIYRHFPAKHPVTAAGLILSALLAGCVQIPPSAERSMTAERIASAHGWHAISLQTASFALRGYLPSQPQAADTLTVYIEGDGLAWLASDMPSADPSPQAPLALQLATQDPAPAAYLARPCQYLLADNSQCRQAYWTSHRFAPEIVQAMSQAVDQLKARFQARKLILVGYSGGGAIAALLAAQRQDIDRLITVAANLDHRAWTQYKRLSPLTGSLNPADYWQALKGVPQIHLLGENDTLLGGAAVLPYVSRFPRAQQPAVIVIPGFNHQCCWAAQWPALLQAVHRPGNQP